MKTFTPQTFSLPTLNGISEKNIEEHLKLYQGYVKHANLILEKIAELSADSEKNAYLLGELQRRFAFEFDGMRNHEYYFKNLEGGAQALPQESSLKAAIEEEWGSIDAWLARFKVVALTRGVGWAVLYYDPKTKRLLNAWVDEQHYGHLTGLVWIFGIDMWEHAFVADYHPSGKKQYIEDYIAQVNWKTVAENFSGA